MTVSVEDFRRRHPSKEHPYLAVVHEALARGDCVVHEPGSPGDSDELLSIYRMRARHLEQFQTAHAIELRLEMERLCAWLGSTSGRAIQWWSFQLADGVSYHFVEVADTQELVGTLRTVSRPEVSEDEWRRLWQG